ncbi:hypothetical protein [Streptomyces axinellae]|uniref:Uncharacterized protein n=1 Tax=Streptomyces axinellae TaxID=552788 RepID=A0ABN3QIK3_9ACTN
MVAGTEAGTSLPTTEDSDADPPGAHSVRGEELFVAAEWAAVTLNVFDRISIPSRHPVPPRDAEGKIVP